LVGETIVILAPDDGRKENVEGSNLCAPFNLETLLNPFAVLFTIVSESCLIIIPIPHITLGEFN